MYFNWFWHFIWTFLRTALSHTETTQVLVHGKICVGIHLSCRQRNSGIANFWNSFSSRYLSILSWLSWLKSLSLRPYGNSRFLLYKRAIVVHIECNAISSVSWLTKKKDKQMSHNATSGPQNCAVCHVLCFFPLSQKNWKKHVDRTLKRTAYSAFCKHSRAYSAPSKPPPSKVERVSHWCSVFN